MRLKKFLLSPWSYIPIIGIFFISSILERKGIVHPIIQHWNIVDLMYFVLGAIVMFLAFRKPKFAKGKS